jgi:drug/metabolite transporter (DMT)-like permease
LGGWLLDEHLTLSTLAGAAILIVSVALAIAARPRSEP